MRKLEKNEEKLIFQSNCIEISDFLTFRNKSYTTHAKKNINFWRYDVGMDKKFKEVRNVLNMKNIIGAGIVMGTLFVSTSAFAAEQKQETTKVSIQDRLNNGSFNFQNQFDNDFASVLQTIQAKKAAQKQRVSLWAEQRSNAIGNSVEQTQASDSSSILNQEGS